MLTRGGRPDLVARAWRPEEDAVVRASYAEFGDASRSHAPRRRYRRHFVCPEDVDDAVTRWMRTETVSEAARRLRVTRKTLMKRLDRAGVAKGRDRWTYWRLDPAEVDRAMGR